MPHKAGSSVSAEAVQDNKPSSSQQREGDEKDEEKNTKKRSRKGKKSGGSSSKGSESGSSSGSVLSPPGKKHDDRPSPKAKEAEGGESGRAGTPMSLEEIEEDLNKQGDVGRA